jgi:D-proline reductase (dithiol) PrdB
VSGRTVDYIPRTRELYAPLPPYRWADNRDLPTPWTPLAKPLARCRVVLAGSGGVYRRDQRPFGLEDDTTIRTIASDTVATDLAVSHFGYPTEDAERDPNCVFPLDRMRELVASGVVGELAPLAITFMGGIYSQRRVQTELLPRILDTLEPLHADLFLLVPS